MSSTDPETSPASVNPYEVTAQDASPVIAEERSVGAERFYALRMDWPDRRRFLKAVGPLRFAAMAGAISMMVSNWPNIVSVFRVLDWYENPQIPLALWMGVIIALVQAGLYGYSCWINWQLADAIAHNAGGRECSLQLWSELQLQSARLSAALAVLGLVSSLWGALLVVLITNSLSV